MPAYACFRTPPEFGLSSCRKDLVPIRLIMATYFQISPCPSFPKRGSPPFAKGRSGGIFVAEFMNRTTKHRLGDEKAIILPTSRAWQRSFTLAFWMCACRFEKKMFWAFRVDCRKFINTKQEGLVTFSHFPSAGRAVVLDPSSNATLVRVIQSRKKVRVSCYISRARLSRSPDPCARGTSWSRHFIPAKKDLFCGYALCH